MKATGTVAMTLVIGNTSLLPAAHSVVHPFLLSPLPGFDIFIFFMVNSYVAFQF